jgi:hypothetical protein
MRADFLRLLSNVRNSYITIINGTHPFCSRHGWLKGPHLSGESHMNASKRVFITLALSALGIGPALADTTVTTTSSCCKPAVIINSAGEAVIVQSTMSVTPIQLVTTTDTVVTGFTLFRPDDLITRRDDLLTRILLEQTDGTLTASQANDLTGRIQRADQDRASLVRDGSVSYYKQVKKLYARFDGIANDMHNESGEGDKQLAGNYLVF